MQCRGQVLGPGEGAIVYGDSISWKDQDVQGQGQGVQGKVGRIPGVGRDSRGRAGSPGAGSPRKGRKVGEAWGSRLRKSPEEGESGAGGKRGRGNGSHKKQVRSLEQKTFWSRGWGKGSPGKECLDLG